MRSLLILLLLAAPAAAPAQDSYAKTVTPRDGGTRLGARLNRRANASRIIRLSPRLGGGDDKVSQERIAPLDPRDRFEGKAQALTLPQ